MTKSDDKLPNFLRAWRKRASLSQEALADKAGFTPGAISQFETGVSNLTVPSLAALSAVLGCKPGDILSYPPDSAPLDKSPENQLRLAMLAFGVDAEDLGRAVSAVKVFLDDLDEQSSPDLQGDRSEPASPRREVKPSRSKPRQPSS